MPEALEAVLSTSQSTSLQAGDNRPPGAAPLWVKGQSGNPGGRPSTTALKAALRPMEQAAYDAIRDGLHCDDIKIRCENAWKLIERLYGKVEMAKEQPAWLSDEKIVEMLS